MKNKEQVLKTCQLAGYSNGTLTYGGFVDGKHYVCQNFDGFKKDALIGPPVILVVQNDKCRLATFEEESYYYKHFVDNS